MATDNFWGRFRRWRRHRPFWGGLILVLSALELFLSANMALNGIEVHLGPQGFLSYLLPLLLLICGALSWFSPAQRLFYGIVALLTALYTFVGLNLGGFFIGMLLGIVGGALVIAWGPPRIKPGDEQAVLPSPGEPDDLARDEPADHHRYGHPGDAPTERIEIAGHDDRPRVAGHDDRPRIAGHDDRPHEEPLRRSTQDAENTAIVPGMSYGEPPIGGSGRRLGKNPKALAVGLIALAVTAGFLVAGSTMPASAEACPAGLPSRSAPTTSSAAADKVAAKAKGTGKAAAPKTTRMHTTSSAKSVTTRKPASPTATSADEGSSHPILDGIQNFVDGVGNLLGINDDASSAPSTSPTPSESASKPADPEPTKTAGPGTTAEPSKPAEPAGTADPATTTPAKSGASGSVQPTATGSEIPCLGARIYGKVASADDIPFVSAKPGLLKVDSLTMYNSTYDGVVSLPTKEGGTIKSLKFSMDKVVNKGFNLTIDEAGSARTVIKSNELTTDQNVRFYTPKFQGKLFGLIPVTFTPESPPPLTLPVLWFTDTEIQLAYVRCDTLTADPLKITEPNS